MLGADRSDTLDADQVLVAGKFGASSSIPLSSPSHFSITEIVYLSIKSALGPLETNKYLTSVIDRASKRGVLYANLDFRI